MLAACATDPLSKVIAIETSRSAVRDAERNLGHRDALVVRGEVGGWHAEPGTEVDVVLADPARSGLGKPGVAALARLGAPVLVLVSCDAASLGRDAKLLAVGRLPPRALGARRHVPAHDPHRGRHPLHGGVTDLERPISSPLRSTVTGPSSLMTMTVAAGSSKL